ncbi:MAG: AraC family transcriptional regulator [Pseudomonadota bacterium]
MNAPLPLPAASPAGLPAAYDHYGAFYSDLYPGFESERRAVGSAQLTMLSVAQTSHQTSDPAIGQIVFRLVSQSGLSHSSVDCGAGRRTLSGRVGSFYLAPAHAVADWQAEGDHEVTLLAAPEAVVHRLMQGEAGGRSPLASLYGQELIDGQVTGLMQRIWCEGRQGGPGAALTVDGLFLMLLGRLATLAADGCSRDTAVTVAPLDQTRLRRVLDYIDAHLGEALDIERLSTVACMSPHHFSRRFAEATGASPHRFVRARRIAAGQRRLVESDAPISAIAFDCGFANQSHFTSVFRAQIGVPPARYRSQHRPQRH